MTTLAAIIAQAEGPSATFVDAATPAGHFGVTARILGIVTTYMLKGTEGDPTAPIVGRVEIIDHRGSTAGSMVVAYRGAGLKGGTFVGTFRESYAELFARITAE